MEDDLILPDMLVSDVLDRWPHVLPVFMKYRMACVGCSMSIFETLSSAAGVYDLSLVQFLEELNAARST